MKRVIWSLSALAVVAGITFWLYNSGSQKSTIQGELTDFAVKDTAAVDRIFMADEQGNTILLERQEDYWSLNGQFIARPDGINILLETINRVRVKSPVSQPAMENTLKDIMGNHTKIEIYQGGDTPMKTYFVGAANQLHTGTHMLIEGSSRPFVTHIEGHHGFLTTRYFTNENEWRMRDIFRYSYGDLAMVEVTYAKTPEHNFRITDQGDHEHFDLAIGAELQPENAVNDVAVVGYLANYKQIPFESFEETKDSVFIDSVLNSRPHFTIRVQETSGNERLLYGYRKPLLDGYDPEGNPIDYDLDRLYLYYDDKEFVVAQYTITDKLTFKAYNFLVQK